MIKETTLIRKKIKRIETIFKYLDKTETLFVSSCLFSIFTIGFISMMIQFNLTSIARENYYNVKSIEKMNYEISNVKSEILELNNMVNIQNKSKELGYIYNKNVKYVK